MMENGSFSVHQALAVPTDAEASARGRYVEHGVEGALALNVCSLKRLKGKPSVLLALPRYSRTDHVP